MTPEQILEHAGMKKTKQRLSALTVLCRAREPLSAEMIHERLDGISLSTIYRMLERFYEQGIVSKTTFDVQDSYFYSLQTETHGHYAVCLSCHRRKHIDACPLEHVELGGFTVTGHKLELYGYCEACREKMK